MAFRLNFFHIHRFEPYVKDAPAYWRKGSRGGFIVNGMIGVCRCSKMRFFPHDRRLFAVDVAIERRRP